MLRPFFSEKPFLSFNAREILIISTLLLYATWLSVLVLGYLKNNPSNLDYYGKPIGADFVQFYDAGMLFSKDPKNLYDYAAQKASQELVVGSAFEGHYNFNYPPIVAHMFKLLSLIEYRTSFVVWTFIQFCCLVYSLSLLGLLNRRNLALSLGFFPAFCSFSFGQNGLISLAILSKSHAELRRNNALLSGVILGLLCFKPQLLISLLFVLAFRPKQHMQVIAGLLMSSFAFLLVHVTYYYQLTNSYIQLLLGNLGNLTSSNFFPIEKSYSIISTMNYHHVPSAVKWGIFISLTAYGFYQHRRTLRHCSGHSAITILLSCLFAPYLMIYDLCILLIPVLTLLGGTGPYRLKHFVLLNFLFIAALVNRYPYLDLAIKFLFLLAALRILNCLCTQCSDPYHGRSSCIR